MIKSNILKDNNIRFMTDISIREDTCFSFMVFPKATRFKIIPENFIFIELDLDLFVKYIISMIIKIGK